MTGNFFFGAFLTPLDQRLVVDQGSENFLPAEDRINPFLIQGIMLTEEGLSPESKTGRAS